MRKCYSSISAVEDLGVRNLFVLCTPLAVCGSFFRQVFLIIKYIEHYKENQLCRKSYQRIKKQIYNVVLPMVALNSWPHKENTFYNTLMFILWVKATA